MASDTYDYIIIGSGFGGSVSAMRLTEKGYSVLVLEKANDSKTKISPNPIGSFGNISGCPGCERMAFYRSAFSKE